MIFCQCSIDKYKRGTLCDVTKSAHYRCCLLSAYSCQDNKALRDTKRYREKEEVQVEQECTANTFDIMNCDRPDWSYMAERVKPSKMLFSAEFTCDRQLDEFLLASNDDGKGRTRSHGHNYHT